MALNFVHNGLRFPDLDLLGRCPNALQLSVFHRLRALLVACDLPGRFPVAPGRSGFEFIARLVELEHFAGSVPEMNPDPYTGASLNPQPLEKIGRIGSEHRFTSKAQFSAIQPYRSLVTSRLKISGTGLWPLADFLDGILWLPYQEPLVLEHHQDVVWSGPDLKGESKEENLQLLRLWDSQGLLALFNEPHPSGFECRVFNAHKNESTDRQIGDRRWFNGSEYHPQGPSRDLPGGASMTSLHCPVGCTLVGCVSDRKDFYHQAAVTRQRAFSNLMPFEYDPKLFSGSQALQELLDVLKEPTSREVHGDRLRMKPRSVLVGDLGPVRAGFKTLFQGDHLGVEYALQGHIGLLESAGLLHEDEVVRSHQLFPRGPVWQGLVIDDFFCISCEPSHQSTEAAVSVSRLEAAERAYAQHEVRGSDEKTIRGAEIFKVIGAEINSGVKARNAGLVAVSAPISKRIALASLSLRVAAMPIISRGLAARLSGNWVSVMMFRRCLSCLLSKLFAFCNRTADEGDDVMRLPRDVAEELVLCSVLSLVAATDVSVPYDRFVYATDASNCKGAVTKLEAGAQMSELLWLGGDRKGCYTMLDNPARAILRSIGEEAEAWTQHLSSPARSIDFRFDIVEICGGSGVLSAALSKAGLHVCVPIDLSRSPQFDVTSLRMLEWVMYMLKEKRLKAVVCEPVCTTFSPAQHPASRGYSCPEGFDRSDPKTLLGNTIAFRCLCIAWYAWRVGAIALVEQPRLSKMAWLSVWRYLLQIGFAEAITASCVFGSPHRKEFRFLGCHFEVHKLERRCPGGHQHVRIEGKYTKASSVYVDKLAEFLAENLAAGIRSLDRVEADCPQVEGLESVVINDLLQCPGWSVASEWSWQGPCHINVLESRSYVELLKFLLRHGGDRRFVSLLDSRVAKGAHGKGRSSAVSLAPSLYRGCCPQIAGNLHGSLGFAPTRLNTADAPTREKDLPCPADHSVVDFLPVSQLSRLHALQVSRPFAGWLRLCILIVCVRGGEADTGFGFPSMPPCGFPGFLGGLSVGLFDLLGSYLSLAVSAVSVLLGVGLPCVVAVLGVTYLGSCLAFGLPKPLFSGVPRFGLLCALLCCCSLRVSSHQINSRKVWVGLAVVPSFSYGMPLNPGNADEQQRARRRAGIVLQADRVVLQSTRSRRDDLLTAFDLWLAENMQVTLHELLSGRYDAEAISDALVCYGKELYTAGKAYGRFSETINGITARKPGLRRQLASAWDLAFNWVVDEPHEHHTALPLTIMLALSALALLWGWAREASLIMFRCSSCGRAVCGFQG